MIIAVPKNNDILKIYIFKVGTLERIKEQVLASEVLNGLP
jgi:hypothetical protein